MSAYTPFKGPGDVDPYRLSANADLMERARAAAAQVDLGAGDTTVRLRVMNLWPFLRAPK